jgi:HK97 family phage major capsid protein
VVTSNEEPIAREEQRKLIALAGRTFGMESHALRAISEGQSLEEFRGVVEAEQVRRAAAEKPAGHIDLSEREAGAYNPGKAIFALANGGKREGLEFEVSREMAKRSGKETDGFFMPLNVRASVPGQIATTASLGGSAVQTIVMPIIDILRAKLISARAGATYLTGLSGNLQFPRQITGNTFAWVGENPSSANTLTSATFDTVTLSPKTGIADSAFSRQVLAQTSHDMQAWVINELLSTVAIGIDNAVFNGTASNNQPRGLRNQSSIGNRTLGAAGAALTWADVVGLESDVAAQNADMGRLGYVTNAKVRGKLKTTLKSTVAGADWIWEGGNDPGTINGYNAFVSNQLPSNLTQGTSTTICSSIVFGNFADLLVGEFGGGVEVLVNPYLYAGQGMISVHTIAMVDVAIRHYESFSKSDAVLTA